MGKYSAVLTEVVARLNYHVGSGRDLDGYKFEEIPIEEAEGQKDLPAVRLYIPSLAESFRASEVGMTRMGLIITVSTSKKDGIVEHVKKVEKVMDAIEKNTSGVIDAGLKGTLLRPMGMTLEVSRATTLSITSEIRISAEPRPFERGKRS